MPEPTTQPERCPTCQSDSPAHMYGPMWGAAASVPSYCHDPFHNVSAPNPSEPSEAASGLSTPSGGSEVRDSAATPDPTPDRVGEQEGTGISFEEAISEVLEAGGLHWRVRNVLSEAPAMVARLEALVAEFQRAARTNSVVDAITELAEARIELAEVVRERDDLRQALASSEAHAERVQGQVRAERKRRQKAESDRDLHMRVAYKNWNDLTEANDRADVAEAQCTELRERIEEVVRERDNLRAALDEEIGLLEHNAQHDKLAPVRAAQAQAARRLRTIAKSLNQATSGKAGQS